MKFINVVFVWTVSLQLLACTGEREERREVSGIEIFKFDFSGSDDKWERDFPKYSDLEKAGTIIFTENDITGFELDDRQDGRSDRYYKILFTNSADERLLELLRANELNRFNVVLAIDGLPMQHPTFACAGCRAIDGYLPSGILESLRSRREFNTKEEAEKRVAGDP